MASGASAGTHGYADNTHDWGWRLGSYSTARQRHITNAVRGVRASRGWSASTPRKAVSDPRVSGWGSGRGHHSAVQTASASSKDSSEEPTRSQIHRVSTSTMASGASAGTHGYTDNTHDGGWRSGSYSTARQRHITNAVRGVRASRGWSASTPRKAVSDSRVSGWGSGRGHHSAVQTASPYRRRQSCHHEQTRSSGPIDLVHACYWTFKDDSTGPAIGTASTFGRPRRGDFEGSSCNTAAGVSSGGKTGQPPAPRGPGRPGLTCSHVCAMKLVKFHCTMKLVKKKKGRVSGAKIMPRVS